MKKILTILAVAAALVSGMMFTGCSTGDDDDILGPTNTWCDVPITKKDASGNATVLGYASFIYSDAGFTSTSTGSGNLKNNMEIKDGITVVVWLNGTPSSDSLTGTILSGLSANQYVMKNFPKATSTEVQDGTDASTKKSITGSKAVWNAGYIFNGNLRKSDNQHKNPAAPTPLTNGASYTDATTILQNFTWKTMLKQLLINSL